MAGKRIAVVGVAGEHTVTSTLPLNVKHLEFRDAPAEAARVTKELRDAGKADADQEGRSFHGHHLGPQQFTGAERAGRPAPERRSSCR